MSFSSHLKGISSAAEYPVDMLMNLCPVDGRPVEIVLALDRLLSEKGQLGWYRPERHDMWRFGALLALDIDDPLDRQHIVSLGEGNTPLIDMAGHPLAKKERFQLQVKLEGRAVKGYGSNPTGSFKDRGMAMTVSMAKRHGLKRLAVPTQGNAGDSLAAYAIAAGLEAAIVMPRDTPSPIIDRVDDLSRRVDGIHYELVEGTIREAGERVRDRWLPEGYFSVATFQEPGWRIEGKKTLGLEIAEPAQAGGNWALPDVIVYPTGGGTGLLGMWKAFAELESLGLIDERRPRMVSVQSDATRPIVDAFENGWLDTQPSAAGHTRAVGLNVPGGVGHFRVLEILRQSCGGAVSVSEEEISAAMTEEFSGCGGPLSP
ncbi:MAG: threonine synthase, partial [Gammaproteobacteria bacterium]